MEKEAGPQKTLLTRPQSSNGITITGRQWHVAWDFFACPVVLVGGQANKGIVQHRLVNRRDYQNKAIPDCLQYQGIGPWPWEQARAGALPAAQL